MSSLSFLGDPKRAGGLWWRHDAPKIAQATSPNIMTPSAEAEESDYGSDLDEDDAFRILTSTERGGSEQESLRPVLPETVDGDERAPAVHIPRSPSSSQPAESVWTSNVPAAALPTAGRPPTQEELELFGSTQDSMFTWAPLPDISD